jgi:uncharacterized membrane protein YvbJ
LINCPNCGNPVREDAKFCGNCGVDVQAALAAAQQAASNEPQPAQYAYPPQQQPSAFGGLSFRRDGERSPMAGRILIVAVIVIAVGCAFCCGLLFGFEILSPMFPPGPTPRPSATPTKESFQFLETFLRQII